MFLLGYIWAFIIIISVFCAVLTGKIGSVSAAVLSGAQDAVQLVIAVAGMMAFWTGIMKIAENCGITRVISKWFRPLIHLLFPECEPSGDAARAICLNITANLMGLGNAATPFGIKAMKQLQKQNPHPQTATKAMMMFGVINTASLQLIPTLLCTLRQSHSSSDPMAIVPYLWVASLTGLLAGVTSLKFLNKARLQKHD